MLWERGRRRVVQFVTAVFAHVGVEPRVVILGGEDEFHRTHSWLTKIR